MTLLVAVVATHIFNLGSFSAVSTFATTIWFVLFVFVFIIACAFFGTFTILTLTPLYVDCPSAKNFSFEGFSGVLSVFCILVVNKRIRVLLGTESRVRSGQQDNTIAHLSTIARAKMPKLSTRGSVADLSRSKTRKVAKALKASLAERRGLHTQD